MCFSQLSVLSFGGGSLPEIVSLLWSPEMHNTLLLPATSAKHSRGVPYVDFCASASFGRATGACQARMNYPTGFGGEEL